MTVPRDYDCVWSPSVAWGNSFANEAGSAACGYKVGKLPLEPSGPGLHRLVNVRGKDL